MSAVTSSGEIGEKEAKQLSAESLLRKTGSLEVGGGRTFPALSRDDPIVATLSEKNLRKSLASSHFDE
jgi:hypothetical protein